MDGNIFFVVGTQIDGVITPDAKEVPVAKILDYVSPAELERYENQDFFDEDERERLLPPKKPRGRPRKGDTVVPSFNIAPIGEETSREQSLLPEASVSIKKKIGRPIGSYKKTGSKFTSVQPSIPSKVKIGRPIGSYKRGHYKKKVDRFTSTKPSVLSEPSTSIKTGPGRPPRQKNLSVVIPSFNGPQPQELESAPSAESESDEKLGAPKPQYSMVAASGLGQSDTEDVTSRDPSVELVPSIKRRRLDTAFINLSSDANGDERSPHPPKRARVFPESSPDPIADDSAALLRQFQARVYGPDHSAKSSTIPHQQSKPSPTLDDSSSLLRQFRAHTHSSSLGSSSSDSLMGPTPRPLKPLPAQYVSSKPLPKEKVLPQQPPPRGDRAKVPASYLKNSITVSCSPWRPPAKTTSTRPTSPSKSIPRKVSLTPHFPPSTSFNHGPMDGSADSRPQSSLSSTSRHAPSQRSNTAFSQSSRMMPARPKKKKASPTPRIAPSQLSQTSSKSKLGFAGLAQAKDITDYFAPKATVAKTTPIPAPHSPTLQLLGPEDSESEDQLARKSSSDSISSKVVIVRQNRGTSTNKTATTAEARPQKPSSSNAREPIDLGSSEDDSSEDESEAGHDSTTHISNPAALVQPTASSANAQSSAEALNRAFEIEDDEDSDSDSDSKSDSLSSEVMIVRPS